MTRGAMKSIAFMATALLVVLGHRGDAASLLPEHMASTVENSAEAATLWPSTANIRRISEQSKQIPA